MPEDAHGISVHLSPSERLVVCRNAGAHLRSLAARSFGVRRLALLCQAKDFDRLAMEAERQVNLIRSPDLKSRCD